MLMFLLLLALPLFGQEVDLNLYEKTLYSQNGEDGVLAKLFQLIEGDSRYCVEVGAGDGIYGSDTYLLRLQEWQTLLLDRGYEIPTSHLHREFVTAENINDLFRTYEVPADFDLLSIHIGYNDFYIWKALDAGFRPAVVLISYNGLHAADEDKVVKYRPYYSGDSTDYFGASLLALHRLGQSKGYTLIYADQAGRRGFFVRDDLLAAKDLHFKNEGSVEDLYHPSQRRPEDDKHRKHLSSTDFR